MSIRQMIKVWEHEFSHPQQSVMMALADHAHDDGSNVRPSVNYIAWKTGYCRRSVQNIISELKSAGILVLTQKSDRRTPNEYLIDWEKATPKKPFERTPNRGAGNAPHPQNRGESVVNEGCTDGEENGLRGAPVVHLSARELHPNLLIEPSDLEPSKNLPPIVPPKESEPMEREVAPLQTAGTHERAIAATRNPDRPGGCQGQQLGIASGGLEVKHTPPPAADEDFEATALNYSDARVANLRNAECSTAADRKAIAKRPKVLDHFDIREYWQGPGLNDFAPELIRGAIAHLQNCSNGNATRVGAQDWIRKRLTMLRRDSEYEQALGDLEARFNAGKPSAQAALGSPEDPYGPEALRRLWGAA